KTVISVPSLHIESSRNLISRNRAMITVTRQLVARNRRRLNPWWGFSGGSDEQDPADELRSSIRQRLAQGEPVPAPRRSGPGGERDSAASSVPRRSGLQRSRTRSVFAQKASR